MEDDVIIDVGIEPNPAQTNGQYKITVMTAPIVYGLLTMDGNLLLTMDNFVIEYQKEG